MPLPTHEDSHMAKKKAEVPESTTEPTPETPPSSNGESVAGYFRPIIAENPGLLNERSNEFLYQKWLSDHPGETVVPENVKSSLSNLKSILRKKKGGKRGRPKKEAQPTGEAVQTPTPRPRLANAKLEQLEQSIDESLALAKQFDREGLEDVIRLLRSARNKVVVQIGME